MKLFCYDFAFSTKQEIEKYILTLKNRVKDFFKKSNYKKAAFYHMNLQKLKRILNQLDSSDDCDTTNYIEG